ncbi:glycoside hydrolase superfamily [Mycena belliarum]|uniref:beta-glucosidase n=1 Tax=Mycena belliarum TaxID=1033014 RepID=A0AAD6UCM6_9AGAR|nr:glycoside hydrolase superfamily [Mycena belliae]
MRSHSLLSIAALLATAALADVTTGVPDAAPAGFEEWESPIVLPAPDVQATGDWASAVKKARAFVKQLTLPEKINVTTGVDVLGRCVGNTGMIPRLGWKGLCLEDSPLGVRFADFVSAFPAGVNTAATWDVDLIKARGKAMGREHRGKGVNVALGPMTNLARVAAGGRNWEGFGADPFLAGVASVATIEGYQREGVIATVKHFIANEQEHFRGGSLAGQVQSSNIDDRTMHEVYAWPFAESVRAGVGSVMCSYNKINQTQACQNSKLMNGILKEELGFQGFIMSDWAAMINGVQPALAGLDMNMPGFTAYGQGPQDNPDPSTATNSFWGAALIEMVKNGTVPESRVDDMVIRTLAAWYKMGQDKNYPDVNFSQLTQATYLNGVKVNEHVNVQADHYKLIREIGAASTILLKNTKKALPLKVKNLKRIAILGSDAGPNPDGPNGCQDRGCNQGTLAMGWGSGTANFPYLVDPLSAIGAHVQSIDPSVVVEGVLNDFNLRQVATVSSLADACLVFVNANSGEGYITVADNAGDRNNLTLWHNGDALVLATAAVCANTIVVQHVVGAVLVEAWIDHPNVTAVLHAGLPGQESGNAIVDVLFADGKKATNPSARLPYTVAKARDDYPADVLYSSKEETPQITYTEAMQIDYRWFDAKNIAPRFEFGFGLSYTEFAYSGLRVNKRHARRAISSSAALVSASVSPSANATVSVSAPAASITASANATVSASATANVTTSAPASATASASASASSASASASGNATSTTTAAGVISSPIGDVGGPAALYEKLLTVTYQVKNTGGAAGHEVSQLYLGFPAAYAEPPKMLRGFARTKLGRGESKSVTLTLREKDVSVWDVVKQKWVRATGKFDVFVGASSRDIRLTGSFSL